MAKALLPKSLKRSAGGAAQFREQEGLVPRAPGPWNTFPDALLLHEQGQAGESGGKNIEVIHVKKNNRNTLAIAKYAPSGH